MQKKLTLNNNKNNKLLKTNVKKTILQVNKWLQTNWKIHNNIKTNLASVVQQNKASQKTNKCFNNQIIHKNFIEVLIINKQV
jgi:hypothetical protein